MCSNRRARRPTSPIRASPSRPASDVTTASGPVTLRRQGWYKGHATSGHSGAMNRSIASKVAFISLILLPLLLMPLPMRAFATPFDAARVPADADGVGHLDMDAL